MLAFDFKDADDDKKQTMLQDIISNYEIKDKTELIMALGHCQAVLECSQEEFSQAVGLSSRSIRVHKKEYLDLYTKAYEKYKPETPELKDVDIELEQDALESVYVNLLSRLQNPKTKTKDLALILDYFNINSTDLKKYASTRNQTLRGFLLDNMDSLVPDEDTQLLIKSLIAESSFLYQGTKKTVGNTANSLEMNLDNPLVRLEIMSFGLLWVSLFNGRPLDDFNNHVETLRMLKLATGIKAVNEKSYKDFDRMDGRVLPSKPITDEDKKQLVYAFGADEGTEMYDMLINLQTKVDKKTKVQMPKYEDVKADYAVHLKPYSEMGEMPVKVMLARLDAWAERHNNVIHDKYKQFLNNTEEQKEQQGE